MYSVLLNPRKLRAIGYMRVASRENVLCPELLARLIKADQTMSKYDYQRFSKAHSLIKEKLINNR